MTLLVLRPAKILDALRGIICHIGDVDILIAVPKPDAQILANRAAEAQSGAGLLGVERVIVEASIIGFQSQSYTDYPESTVP